MNDLRTAAQQALQALEQSETTVPYEGFGMARREAERKHQAAITALRAALAQEQPNPPGCEHCNHPLYAATRCRVCGRVTEQAEPVEPPKPAPLKRGTTGRCTRKVCECEKEGLGPECIHLEPVIDGYLLWSGIPKAEQVEPVAKCIDDICSEHFGRVEAFDYLPRDTLLYTSPPQRKPLTEEEIDKATAEERDALLDHIYEYGTAAEGVLERIRKLCRAIERAHGIGDNT